MSDQQGEPIASATVEQLFERLAGQLGDQASSERQLQAELKGIAAKVEQADERQALQEGIAEHAQLAKAATGLSKTLEATKRAVQSDLDTLAAVAARPGRG